jgi:hypothetical protein
MLVGITLRFSSMIHWNLQRPANLNDFVHEKLWGVNHTYPWTTSAPPSSSLWSAWGRPGPLTALRFYMVLCERIEMRHRWNSKKIVFHTSGRVWPFNVWKYLYTVHLGADKIFNFMQFFHSNFSKRESTALFFAPDYLRNGLFPSLWLGIWSLFEFGFEIEELLAILYWLPVIIYSGCFPYCLRRRVVTPALFAVWIYKCTVWTMCRNYELRVPFNTESRDCPYCLTRRVTTPCNVCL